MKTYNHLFEKIVSEDNIRLAIRKAAKGKRRKATVRKALKNIDEVARYLSEVLKSGEWRPLSLHQTKEINDGIELKKHGKETKYVAKLDIKKFFHNAKPSFIFHEIRKTIRDKRVLRLFALILRANKQVINGEIVKGGIPIGFFVSPHFANILLNQVDHMIKEKLGVEFYVRYMDDMILFSTNKRKLKKACIAVSEEIQRLGMNLKPIWQVHRMESVTFIGYQFQRGYVRIRDRLFLKVIRLIKRVKAKVRMTVHDCLRVLSYMGRFKNADTYQAFKRYVAAFINIRELRKRVSNFYKKKKGVVKYAF